MFDPVTSTRCSVCGSAGACCAKAAVPDRAAVLLNASNKLRDSIVLLSIRRLLKVDLKVEDQVVEPAKYQFCELVMTGLLRHVKELSQAVSVPCLGSFLDRAENATNLQGAGVTPLDKKKRPLV